MPIPMAQLIHEFLFCFCRPFLHTHTYTNTHKHTGKTKNPLELSQNEIKIQGIMCFDQRVSFFFLSCVCVCVCVCVCGGNNGPSFYSLCLAGWRWIIHFNPFLAGSQPPTMRWSILGFCRLVSVFRWGREWASVTRFDRKPTILWHRDCLLLGLSAPLTRRKEDSVFSLHWGFKLKWLHIPPERINNNI